MGIICQDTKTISYISQLICGKLVKIYDIKPIFPDIIDVTVDGRIHIGVGNTASILDDGKILTLQLISKNVGAGTAIIKLTVSTNPCIGATCPDICGTPPDYNLYYQTCSPTYDAYNIPIGYRCRLGTLKEVNSPQCLPPPPIIIPTHVIKFELSPNQYLNYLQQNIVTISARIVDALPFNPDVKYIRTELDPTGKYINVYVKYTGTATMGIYGMNGIYSLGIIDAINDFAKALIPILITIASILITAAIILAGGFTLPVIGLALLAGGVVFILGFASFDLMINLEIAREVINNQQAFIQPTIAKDQGKKALDDAFAASPKTKDDCLTLLKGYQEADIIYINSLSDKLTKLQLTNIKSSYNTCTNSLIDGFNANTVTCDGAIAGFSPCANTVYAGTGEQFNVNYNPDDAFKPPIKPIDWEKILLYGGIGLVGLIILTRK